MEVLPEALKLGKSSQFIPYVSIDYLWVPVGSFVLLVAVEIHHKSRVRQRVKGSLKGAATCEGTAVLSTIVPRKLAH